MAKSTSEYYKTLADLNGDVKFDALNSFQFARKMYSELIEPHKGLVALVKSLAPIAERISWLKDIQDAHRSITQYLDDILQLSKGIHSLPSEGWYFSLQFIDSLAISNLHEYLQRDPKAFEADVIAAFNKQLGTIEKKLTIAFPKRAQLLSDLFKHQRQADYNASIVLALTQADGISKDIFSVKDKNNKPVAVGFFDMTNSKADIRAQKLALSFDVPENSIFSILFNQLAKDDRNDSLVLEGNTIRLSDLNRHAILHGESTDYGTLINSVKAILLLDFIEDLHLMDTILKENEAANTTRSST
jgi:hypothetical protein